MTMRAVKLAEHSYKTDRRQLSRQQLRALGTRFEWRLVDFEILEWKLDFLDDHSRGWIEC